MSVPDSYLVLGRSLMHEHILLKHCIGAGDHLPIQETFAKCLLMIVRLAFIELQVGIICMVIEVRSFFALRELLVMDQEPLDDLIIIYDFLLIIVVVRFLVVCQAIRYAWECITDGCE